MKLMSQNPLTYSSLYENVKYKLFNVTAKIKETKLKKGFSSLVTVSQFQLQFTVSFVTVSVL